MFVELVCQQPHDQYSDQRSDNSQKYRICLDCSRHSHLEWITSPGFCNAEWVSVLARQGQASARSTALLELHLAGKKKQKCLLFTVILCSCSGDFPFFSSCPRMQTLTELCQAQCPGSCGDSMEHFKGTHWCWRDSHGWQAAHQPLAKTHTPKSQKYREWR